MGAPQQALLANGISAPLDSYTANLYGAYSLTKLLTSYAGSAIRVRRSSDNTEQDIGFNGLALDTSALSTFASSGDAFIAKWYDQSGAGNDLVQATTGRQPKIYGSGSYLSNIQFNLSSTDQFLKGPVNGGASSAKSVFRRSAARTFDSFNVDYEYGDSALIGGASGANQLQLLQNSANPSYSPHLSTNSGAAFYAAQFDRALFGVTTNCFIFKKGQASAAASFAAYDAGSSVSNNGTTTSGSPVVTGNFPSYAWALGARSSSAAFGARTNIIALLIYDADKTSDVSAISAILAAL